MIPIRAPLYKLGKTTRSQQTDSILTRFSSGIMILITYFTLCFPRIWAWICTPFNFNLYLVSLIVRDPFKITQNQPKMIFELFQNDFYIRYRTKPRLDNPTVSPTGFWFGVSSFGSTYSDDGSKLTIFEADFESKTVPDVPNLPWFDLDQPCFVTNYSSPDENKLE